MNEQVIKESDELIEWWIGSSSRPLTAAIKTQERVISELSDAFKTTALPSLFQRINHNKEILNHLKTLI